MRFLLDTHIWIWSSLEPHRLTSEVARVIASHNNELFLSPVSIWEMAMLLEKRRLQIDRDFWEWFLKSREDLVLAEAPLTWNVAREFSFTMLAHRDPGDRLLVATAKVYDLTLVTADEKLMSVPGVSVLPNR